MQRTALRAAADAEREAAGDMTKPNIRHEIEKASQFLSGLGYSTRRYDNGPAFGIEYISTGRNRSITLTHQGHSGGVMSCTFRRKYLKWYNPLISDINRRKFFAVEMEFEGDKSSSLPTTLSETDFAEFIQQYAAFLERKLLRIIAGKEWIDEAGSSVPGRST